MTEAVTETETANEFDPLEDAYDAWGRGDYGAAVAELNQILARRPYSTEAFEMKVDVLRHANINLYFAGVIEKRYLAKKGAYKGLSDSNRRLGRWQRINAEFDRMSDDWRQKPDSTYRAAVLKFSNEFAEPDTRNIDLGGVADMSLALGTPSALLLKGLVDARMGNYDEAIQALETAVTASPPTHEGFAVLSRIYAAKGRRRRAAALAQLSLISTNHLWYTTGAINFSTLNVIMHSYEEFNPLQSDASDLRYSGIPRFLSALEDLPRTPVRLPLRFKRIVKWLLPIRLILAVETLLDKTPAGRMLRERRYS